ncbi:cadmium resistance transporter family protein [Pseudarthrobacter siccitolerans]|uniref:Cadmium resistance transporter family protein n=1 Tax=Pseudarthrobacter siccitolerans TaxID=861266 RepID=A0A024H2R4_9MICC|nr:cadmium resistance transporter [Pseudarthrobacter siccitolerans]CCQ46049.1 cadmium resistance transporter family protein [Pseudarthrobacter siccitolerans]
MLAIIAAAAAMFAATNIDDIVVLTVLFLASAKGRPRPWEIVGGQYLGFITLVGISVLAALGLAFVPDEWVGWLGLIPLFIGVVGLIRFLRKRREEEAERTVSAVGLLSVAGITIANGADNIAIYTPIFRTMRPQDTVVTIIVFLILVAVWCALGRVVGTHPKVTETLEKIEHWLVPAVFIGLGLFILVSSGVVPLLLSA